MMELRDGTRAARYDWWCGEVADAEDVKLGWDRFGCGLR